MQSFPVSWQERLQGLSGISSNEEKEELEDKGYELQYGVRAHHRSFGILAKPNRKFCILK